MAVTSQKFATSLLAAGLFSFVILSVFGLGHLGGMEANKDGNMEGCIFTGKTMLCKMGVMEHISLWQSMFNAMPQENLMLLALLVLLVAVVFITKNILASPRLAKSDASIQKLYLIQHPDLPLFNHLKEAFSQGILNPQIYEFATL